MNSNRARVGLLICSALILSTALTPPSLARTNAETGGEALLGSGNSQVQETPQVAQTATPKKETTPTPTPTATPEGPTIVSVGPTGTPIPAQRGIVASGNAAAMGNAASGNPASGGGSTSGVTGGDPSPGGSATPTPASTPQATPTLIPAGKSGSLVTSGSNVTSTPGSTATATPDPNATATPESNGAATPTPDPNATATPDGMLGILDPNATATPDPNATATPDLNGTATPDPNATATPDPNATATPDPDATATPGASASPSPSPSPTPGPTATPAPKVPSLAGTIKIPKNLTTAQKGSLVEWSRANSMWRVGQTVTVMDPYTGTTFRAYRIGGYNHADYVPATKKDTAIVYALYGNHWTWTRKSMLVELDGKWIAASTNGMPHGQWSKLSNDMNGMLCMHFLYSKTHIHNAQCPQHQKCVLAAAQRVGKVSASADGTVTGGQTGELMDWLEADKLWAVGSTATVMNPITAEEVQVKRVGGTTYAEFEPATAQDAEKIGKAIGNEPTPVLVKIGERWIAASLGVKHEEVEPMYATPSILAGLISDTQAALGAVETAEAAQGAARLMYFMNSKAGPDQPVNFVQQMMVFDAAGQELEFLQQGELTSWAEVDQTWAMEKATLVQDWQTGVVFQIKRVAGNGHAEYQFMSDADEAVFKALIGGSYQLTMRPLMVRLGAKWVAASTLCMPHTEADGGTNTLCMHFKDSLLNTTQMPEPAHQQCVLMASGEWMASDGDQAESLGAEADALDPGDLGEGADAEGLPAGDY